MKTTITFFYSHIRAFAFSCVVLFCCLQTGYAQPVTLDPTFGQSGITEISDFPNPAKDYLYFNSEQRFEIMDIQGRILLRSETAAQAVNVSHLKTGIYFIKFEDGGVRKFVKE